MRRYRRQTSVDILGRASRTARTADAWLLQAWTLGTSDDPKGTDWQQQYTEAAIGQLEKAVVLAQKALAMSKEEAAVDMLIREEKKS